ncbi:MAG TPA: hypothetical protein ENI80_08815 [Acidiferrobacteraceae bacterium]|nr:hypothetical protein [Acidiferrobacteraceae bacterium]
MRKITLTIVLFFFATSASATWHNDAVSASVAGGYSSTSLDVPDHTGGDMQYDTHGHCSHILSHFMALPLDTETNANNNGVLWSVLLYSPPHHLPLESHFQPPRHRLS